MNVIKPLIDILINCVEKFSHSDAIKLSFRFHKCISLLVSCWFLASIILMISFSTFKKFHSILVMVYFGNSFPGEGKWWKILILHTELDVDYNSAYYLMPSLSSSALLPVIFIFRLRFGDSTCLCCLFCFCSSFVQSLERHTHEVFSHCERNNSKIFWISN